MAAGFLLDSRQLCWCVYVRAHVSLVNSFSGGASSLAPRRKREEGRKGREAVFGEEASGLLKGERSRWLLPTLPLLPPPFSKPFQTFPPPTGNHSEHHVLTMFFWCFCLTSWTRDLLRRASASHTRLDALLVLLLLFPPPGCRTHLRAKALRADDLAEVI